MENPRIIEVEAYFDKLSIKMERRCKDDLSSNLHSVVDETKAERSSVTFALMETMDGAVVRVMKKIWTFVECHAVIKVMSKVVRESIWFDHFRDGVCSCEDHR
jgi:hypothetical protein